MEIGGRGKIPPGSTSKVINQAVPPAALTRLHLGECVRSSLSCPKAIRKIVVSPANHNCRRKNAFSPQVERMSAGARRFVRGGGSPGTGAGQATRCFSGR